jgi:hypothetical protein
MSEPWLMAKNVKRLVWHRDDDNSIKDWPMNALTIAVLSLRVQTTLCQTF